MKFHCPFALTFRLVMGALALLILATPWALAAADKGGFTSARTVRTMSDAELKAAPTVRLRGVVLRSWKEAPSFILQDDSDAIHVSAMPGIRPPIALPHDFDSGAVVEVEGQVSPGMFAPSLYVLRSEDIKLVGHSTVPSPLTLTPEAARAGLFDARLVSVIGVVRHTSASPAGNGVSGLEMVFENTRLIVLLDQGAGDWKELVDARIRVTGISSGIWNKRRQITAPCLMRINRSDIEVLTPAPNDPFALQTRSVADIMRYRPQDAPGHRIHIFGTVLLALPDGRVFVYDGERAVCVECTDPTDVAVGDCVDAAGFPSMRERAPLLEDAVLRKRADPGALPQVTQRSAATLIEECNDYELVRLVATLLEAQHTKTGTTLLLQSGDSLFKAIYDVPGPSGEWLTALRSGSTLSLTGLVSFSFPSPTVQAFRPNGFSLLLRSPGDVRILHQSSWWTVGRLAALLGATGALMLILALWNHLLRARAKVQQDIISAQTRREATSEERTRLARELHDTLEQEFVGMTRQTEALEHSCPLPLQAREQLCVLRQMLQLSRDNARRTVWDLRDPALLDCGLEAAIRSALQRMLVGKPIEVNIHAESNLPDNIQPQVQVNALRLTQEAVTNAMKHSDATHIDICLRFADGVLELTIADDGRNATISDTPSAGHFGIMGMRERCEKFGGSFSFQSQPGGGSSVRARIPL